MADVDSGRQGLKVKRGLEPHEVAEDAAGGDDEEIAPRTQGAMLNHMMI